MTTEELRDLVVWKPCPGCLLTATYYQRSLRYRDDLERLAPYAARSDRLEAVN